MLELLHKALFAFVSGFSEFIFTSTSAHQLLYGTVTGYNFEDDFLSENILCVETLHETPKGN